jgi:hypothetical protein
MTPERRDELLSRISVSDQQTGVLIKPEGK